MPGRKAINSTYKSLYVRSLVSVNHVQDKTIIYSDISWKYENVYNNNFTGINANMNEFSQANKKRSTHIYNTKKKYEYNDPLRAKKIISETAKLDKIRRREFPLGRPFIRLTDKTYNEDILPAPNALSRFISSISLKSPDPDYRPTPIMHKSFIGPGKYLTGLTRKPTKSTSCRSKNIQYPSSGSQVVRKKTNINLFVSGQPTNSATGKSVVIGSTKKMSLGCCSCGRPVCKAVHDELNAKLNR